MSDRKSASAAGRRNCLPLEFLQLHASVLPASAVKPTFRLRLVTRLQPAPILGTLAAFERRPAGKSCGAAPRSARRAAAGTCSRGGFAPGGTRAARAAARGAAPQFLRNSQNWKNEFDDGPDNPKRQRGMRCRRFACRSQMPHSTARYPKRTNSLKRLSTLLMSHTEICTTMQVDVP